MLYTRFDALNWDLSVIAMGSVPFGVDLSETESFQILDVYADMGGNFLDTARVYGDFERGVQGVAEKVIGQWLMRTGMRGQMALGTKGGHPDMRDMHAGRLDRQSISEDIEKSLDALQTDHVDIYWLHRDDEARPVGEIMETLNALAREGLTRALGASNWTSARILEANRYAAQYGLMPFCANQPQWSLARAETVEDDTLVQMDKAMYDMHKQTGMAAVPYSSQAKGFYIKYDQGGPDSLSDKAKRRYFSAENMAVFEEIKRVQAKTGLSVGAISLSYLFSQPFPTFPIVGVSGVRQARALRETVQAFLPASAVETLREMAIR